MLTFMPPVHLAWVSQCACQNTPYNVLRVGSACCQCIGVLQSQALAVEAMQAGSAPCCPRYWESRGPPGSLPWPESC